MSAHIYKPHNSLGVRVQPDRCRHSVHEARWGFYQCTRKPSVIRCVDGVEYGFCKQHDPEVVARRDAAQRAKWSAEWDANRRANARREQERKAALACKEAMKKIADGHNDPRSLALEVLAMFPAPTTPDPVA